LEGKTKILFVCLGNIVRSPLAENLFRRLTQLNGIEDQFVLDSAGVGDWHVGEPPDSRMRRVAQQHGLVYDGRARQISHRDLQAFDLIIAMDRENSASLRGLARSAQEEAKIHMLREFDPQSNHPQASVPDPYYGDLDAFEEVYQIIERSCHGLLMALQSGELKA
jgi:protein-tyrosine phosphatase